MKSLLAWAAAAAAAVVALWPRSTKREPHGPGPVTPPPPSGPVTPPPPSPGVDAFGVPFAVGADDPLWPLPGDRRSNPAATWARGRVTADFGDARPFGSSKPRRHHAAEDLRAPRNALVVATERGTIVAVDLDWYEGTGALLVYFDTGITANFGEVEPGSVAEFGLAVGSIVERGQTIARVGRTLMLHFELYTGEHRRTYQWPWNGAPPLPLLDPTEYLELAARTVPP